MYIIHICIPYVCNTHKVQPSPHLKNTHTGAIHEHGLGFPGSSQNMCEILCFPLVTLGLTPAILSSAPE